MFALFNQKVHLQKTVGSSKVSGKTPKRTPHFGKRKSERILVQEFLAASNKSLANICLKTHAKTLKKLIKFDFTMWWAHIYA